MKLYLTIPKKCCELVTNVLLPINLIWWVYAVLEKIKNTSQYDDEAREFSEYFPQPVSY